MRRWLRNCAVLLTVAAGLAGTAAGAARADVVLETPWHPAAAAYRAMLFLCDLKPVMWDLVREAYERKHPAAAVDKPPKAFFESLPDRGEAIAEAIASEDCQALYEAATRAVSQLTRKSLAEAAEALPEPGKAYQKVLDAQAIYRALADFVAQADPEGGRRVGTAWLELTSSVGSKGVLGVGVVAADGEAFAAARKTVDDYLAANFEPETFIEREGLTSLPETVVAARGEVEVRPWLPPGSNLNDQDPLPKLVLNFEEQGIEESDLPIVAYGDMIFDSPLVFADPAKSLGIACSTCHNRSDINRSFFIPGLGHQPGSIDVDNAFFNPIFNDRRPDSVDIPSLRGIRFTAPYGRDGRFASLSEFLRNVHVNEFGGPEPTPFILDALLAYLLEFDFLPNSKLDAAGILIDKASDAARRGERLFRKPFAQMDGRSCASCHVPSANFVDRLAHNIGSGKAGYAGSREAHYDTPTLLGAKFTAPYFHDGSLPTLASVVEWFDNRYELKLTKAEQADLTAYLEAVGDADEPYQKFEGKETPFRLAWEELTTFATTFEALLPGRDAEHASLMLETVAGDLAADASGATNAAAKPKAYELAGLLDETRQAIAKDDWETAETRWNTYKELKEKYDEEMY
jgi:cytochrome c peroxidase